MWLARRIAACAALVVWPAAAAAQNQAPRLELGVFGGAFVPDREHEFYDPGDSAAQPLEDVGPELGLRAAFFPFSFLGIEGEADLLPQSTASGQGVLLYGARGHLILRVPTRVSPFLLGGLGTMGVRSGRNELSNDSDTVGHVGLGLSFVASPRVSLRVEGRGLRAPRAGDDQGTFHFSALLGVSLAFGGTVPDPVEVDPDLDGVIGAADRCPDASGMPPDGCPVPADGDGDGLADDGDRCPTEAETVNGFQEEDGCPDQLPDRDADRVVDATDTCPDEPEDADSFEDEDGCPDRDNDGDRSDDAADRCPLQAGPVDNQGCPDSDRDADSVADRLDNCPDQSGTAANHGCAARQFVALAPGRIQLLDPVTFTTSRSIIRRRSLHVLDNLAAVMNAHPELTRFTIAGYTDERGGTEPNKILSQRRADAVKEYLVAHGVATERLEAVGLGEEQPLQPNTTAMGRSQNRRVEIQIITDAAGPTGPGPQPAPPPASPQAGGS